MEKYLGKIIHGDCIEEIKKIPDNFVDLIFADPPYYLQFPKGKRLKRVDGSEIIPVDNEWGCCITKKFPQLIKRRVLLIQSPT